MLLNKKGINKKAQAMEAFEPLIKPIVIIAIIIIILIIVQQIISKVLQ